MPTLVLSEIRSDLVQIVSDRLCKVIMASHYRSGAIPLSPEEAAMIKGGGTRLLVAINREVKRMLGGRVLDVGWMTVVLARLDPPTLDYYLDPQVH